MDYVMSNIKIIKQLWLNYNYSTNSFNNGFNSHFEQLYVLLQGYITIVS